MATIRPHRYSSAVRANPPKSAGSIDRDRLIITNPGVTDAGSVSATERLLAYREDRPTFVVGSLLVVGFFACYPVLDWLLRAAGIAAPFGFYDFGAYGGAVHRWFDGGAIYQQAEGGGYHGSYLYPPIGLLLFVPFAQLPFNQGVLLWSLVSLGALWLALQLAIGAYGVDLRLWERGLLLWLLLGFQPVLYGIKMGQVTALIGALVTFSLVGLVKGERPSRKSSQSLRYLSGVAITLAAAVKLFFAAGGAHLLADRDRFVGAVATALALAAGSLLVFGVETNLAFLDVLRWGKGWGTEPRSIYLWGPSYFRPLYALSDISLPLRLGGVVCIVALSAVAPDDADDAVFAVGVAAIPLLGPTVHTYDLVVVLPAAIALLAVEFDRDGLPLVPVVALLLVNVHAYGLKLIVEHLPAAPPSGVIRSLAPVLQPGLWGVLLLFGLALFRVSEAVPTSIGRALRWPLPRR